VSFAPTWLSPSNCTSLSCSRALLTRHRCLSIARSHSLHGKKTNALALLDHALDLCSEAGPLLASNPQPSTDSPLSIQVHVQDAKYLAQLLTDMVTRYRALVHIENLRKEEEEGWEADACVPLVERLQDFPKNVSLDNLVDLPPKLQPIAVKPIFLDIAWNYIDYPQIGNDSPAQRGKQASAQAQEQKSSGQEQPPKKKGWFGFGR
jgi:signal recognition particle subunit SRP68